MDEQAKAAEQAAALEEARAMEPAEGATPDGELYERMCGKFELEPWWAEPAWGLMLDGDARFNDEGDYVWAVVTGDLVLDLYEAQPKAALNRLSDDAGACIALEESELGFVNTRILSRDEIRKLQEEAEAEAEARGEEEELEYA